jgi:hypothetical protein
MKLWYPHKIKMKINYEDQFSINPMLNDKIKKKLIKKIKKNNLS